MQFKIQVADAVLRSKLLYGIESAQLNEPEQRRLEVFQLKVLRKMLQMKTTYVNRLNTNEKVFQAANEQKKAELSKKTVVPFKQAYKKSRLQLLSQVILDKESQLHKIIFATPTNNTTQNNLATQEYLNRKVGRPKNRWLDYALADMWEEVQEKHAEWKHIMLNRKTERKENSY